MSLLEALRAHAAALPDRAAQIEPGGALPAPALEGYGRISRRRDFLSTVAARLRERLDRAGTAAGVPVAR
jgi:hypothetical protein